MQLVDLTGYKLSFDDEFSGNQLDTSKWSTQFPFSPSDHVSGESERYQNVGSAHDPFKEAGGVLTITASPAPDLGQGIYASGRIGSEHNSFAFQPGTYIEARMQLPGGQDTGMWPAFWSIPKDLHYPEEMDTLEKVSSTSSGLKSNAFIYATHTNTPDALNNYINTSVDLTNSYHTYGTLWSADGKTVTEYFDGNQIAQGNVPAEWSAHPMYIQANLAVGSSSYPADWAGPADGQSHQLAIDYIRGFSVNQSAVAAQPVSSPDGGGTDFHGAASGQASAQAAAAPASSADPGTASIDTLKLGMSEDYWNGDAQFQVSIDGKQLNAADTVTALHANGAVQDFSFTGNWGAGPHDVAVSFLNDAYAGSPSTDRNLYVESLNLDGKSVGGAALYANGTAHFTVG